MAGFGCRRWWRGKHHAGGSCKWKGFDGQGHQGIGSFPKEAREKKRNEVKLEVPYVAQECHTVRSYSPSGVEQTQLDPWSGELVAEIARPTRVLPPRGNESSLSQQGTRHANITSSFPTTTTTTTLFNGANGDD